MDTSSRRRVRDTWWISATCAVLTVGLAQGVRGTEKGDGATPDPRQIEAGRELFARIWAPKDPRSRGGDGLGPVFNAQSCLACHDQGGPGGAGSAARNIEVVTPEGLPFYGYSYSFAMDFGTGRFQYSFGTPTNAGARNRKSPPIDRNLLAAIHPGFAAAPSVVLHKFGTDPDYQLWRNRVPGQHGTIAISSAERNPTPLFGAGLIDAIPDEAIEQAARRRTASVGRVRGRVARQTDGRIGRFGWKAQTATLAEFVRSAAANEIGLEVPGQPQAADPRLPGIGASGLDMDEADCRDLTAFIRSLPAPTSRAGGDAKTELAAKAGESTFRSIGCADCHLPKLGEVEGIYSDLLLHDMGAKLADSGVYGVFAAGADPAGVGGADRGRDDETAPAGPHEWRTPPLWGLSDSRPYLHDGRASNLEQAILLHGGQGQTSAHRFAQLSSRKKQQLQAFLESLAAPALAEGGRPGLAKAP
jgi:CxxC motif-containing protein (DUF1111 family)